MHLSPYGIRNSKFFTKWPDLLFTPRAFLPNKCIKQVYYTNVLNVCINPCFHADGAPSVSVYGVNRQGVEQVFNTNVLNPGAPGYESPALRSGVPMFGVAFCFKTAGGGKKNVPFYFASASYTITERQGANETLERRLFKAMFMIFGKHSADGYKKPIKGIRQKTLCFGKRTLMTEFLLSKDSILPEHSHPFEQTGYLVQGHILLKIGDTQHDTLPGDSWCIPADTRHGAQIIDDSVAIEIFSPVREDYIPK